MWKTGSAKSDHNFTAASHRAGLPSIALIDPLDNSDGRQSPEVDQQFSSTIHLDSN